MVVIYFSRLGGRLDPHQKVMLEADAKVIAHVLGYDYRRAPRRHANDYTAPVFFVPDDTLLVDEASSLGIRGPNDFYGGVVPHPFVKTKAITHGLVEENAERAAWLVSRFRRKGARDRAAGLHRVQRPRCPDGGEADAAAWRDPREETLGASGKGQTLVTTLQELDALLETVRRRGDGDIWVGARRELAAGAGR